jgi:hypothetical protein
MEAEQNEELEYVSRLLRDVIADPRKGA